MESARRSGANQPVEGQAAQWEVLLQLLTPKLLRGLRAEALRLTGQTQDAEDTLQDTQLKAALHLPQLRDRSRVGPWLYATLRHTVADSRRRAFRAEALMAEPVQTGEACGDEVAEEVARRELARQLGQGLAALLAWQREALRLRYLEGMTFPEIARVLGVPVGTVTSRCRRGLCHLRALLAPDCGNGAFPAEKDD